MEATLQTIESAPGWEQQQAGEQWRFEHEEGLAVPGDMPFGHTSMTERNQALLCEILRLAIAVTERTGLRVLFEWSGPFDGVHVRYYLPGEQRPCVRDVWFDQADPGEAARQLEGIRDFLGRLSGVPGNA